LAELTELSVEGVRSIATARLALSARSNLIYGANGAGKTSLLEAAFLLGRGRTFRHRSTDRLIRRGEPLARVVGQVRREALLHTLGVEVTDGATRARIDGQTPPTLAELARLFPVQILDPELHGLIEEGPSVRRRWLDWAVFHVEPGFAGTWQRYRRALQQRNAALATQRADLAAWDDRLVEEGERLGQWRREAVEAVQPLWQAVSAELVGLEIQMSYQSGWERGTALREALSRALPRDLERQTTSVGPHRAEVALRVGGRPARDVLSRGQQKLAGASLILCQLEYLKGAFGVLPTLLVDDPSAELDHGRLDAFIARVMAIGGQMIVTALSKDFRLFGQPEAVFHVEQGAVEKVY
jgi:DNA replication and repair protein RecF